MKNKETLERGITITHIGKQETLEEAAERNYNEQKLNTYTPYNFKNAFIEGAKSDAAKAYWYNIFKQNL